jgi:hypothetical protein
MKCPSSNAPHLMVLNTYQQMRGATADVQGGRTDEFNLDGILFTCFYEPSVMKDQFCIECGVLDLPQPEDVKWIGLMLQDNWSRHQHDKPIFALRADIGRVVSLWNVSLSALDSASFDCQVRAWVKDVQQWQFHFILDQPSVALTRKSSPIFQGGQFA